MKWHDRINKTRMPLVIVWLALASHAAYELHDPALILSIGALILSVLIEVLC
jgi:hypothetical protein